MSTSSKLTQLQLSLPPPLGSSTLTASVAYKQYYYKCKYHGSFSSGRLAAASDSDAERVLREELGPKFLFSSAVLLTDAEGNEVYARGRVNDLPKDTQVKTKPKAPYPKYSLTEM